MIVRKCAIAFALLLFVPEGARAQGAAPGPTSHEVQFVHGGVTLTGWLDLPQSASARTPVPVVILVGGNNASWRSYDWIFRGMTDSLNKANIGVFRYDHRGDGKSGGSWAFATYEQLADDVIAAARGIASVPGVDSRRVGVWGHSMGGWIAPLAAARSADIAFVITASGPGVTPLIQTAYDHMNQDMARGVARADAIEMDALRRDLWAYYAQPTQRHRVRAQKALEWARGRPWYSMAAKWRELQGVTDSVPGMGYVLSAPFDTALAELRRDAAYDPTSALQRVHVPMLALFGGADRVVPNEISIAAMKTAFAVSGNTVLTVHVFPGANHTLLTGTARDASSFASGYLRMLSGWIANVPKLPGR